MNYIALLALLTFVESLVLAAVVLQRGGNGRAARPFVTYVVFMACGSFVEFQLVTASTPEEFLLWKGFDGSIFFSTVAILHFVLVYTESPLARRSWLLHTMYLVAGCSVLVHATLVAPVGVGEVPWGYFSHFDTVGTVVTRVHAAVYGALGLTGWLVSIAYFVGSRERIRRARAGILMVSTGVLLLGGFLFEVVLPLWLHMVTPFSATTAYFLVNPFLAFAVMRYDLLALSPEDTIGDVLGQMEDGVLLVDHAGLVCYANRAMSRMAPENGGLVGRDASTVLGEGDARDALGAVLNTNSREPAVASIESEIGTEHDLRRLSVTISAHRHRVWGTIGAVCVVRDITQAFRAREMERTVERMMRHDLRSPLTAVVGLPQTMLDDRNLTEEQVQTLGFIARSGRLMQSEVETYLSLRRMEDGTFDCVCTPTDVLLRLRDAFAHLGDLAGRVRVSLAATVDGRPMEADMRVLAMAQAALLYSLIANLVRNAIEAAPADTTVSVGIERDAGVLIRVHNLGVVPDDARPRFFDKFVTSGKPDGTGLGTYTARLIAEGFGGSIRFESEQERGTTVSVRLRGVG